MLRHTQSQTDRLWRRLSLVMTLLLLVAGCGGVTQIEPGNRRVLQGLMTAVSSRKVDWLDASVQQMEAARSAGTMSDEEYAALEGIVSKAKQNDWAGAQALALALNDGQTGTGGPPARKPAEDPAP